jgi:CO/xanthine dehydrogenase Mo-binding subunit
MRGFGVPQVALAHEGQMDGLADKLGMDRLEFRIKNALRPGLTTATNQKLETSVGMIESLEKIKPIYDQWNASKTRSDSHVQGVGLGAMFYGIGNTGVPNPSTAQMEWIPYNGVYIFTGAAEIGQGSDTVFRQMVSSRFKLDPKKVKLIRGDTGFTTDAGATSASRQTYISGGAVMAAADALEEIIFSEYQKIMEVGKPDIEMGNGKVWVKGSPDTAVEIDQLALSLYEHGERLDASGEFNPETTPLDPNTGQGSPYGTYAFAAHAALVEVNPWTGETMVKRVAAAHDVGKAINPDAVVGQICGGVLMGLGMTLMEEYSPGATLNFDKYHIPTIQDTPEIDPIIIVEAEEKTGPYGAKGVGEPALIPTIPTIASAVGEAVGSPMKDLPISLERIMEALGAAQNED